MAGENGEEKPLISLKLRLFKAKMRGIEVYFTMGSREKQCLFYFLALNQASICIK